MHGAIIIRPAAAGDAPAVCALNKRSLGYDYLPDKTAERLCSLLAQSGVRLYVACYGDRVIGYIHGSSYEASYFDPLVNIMALAVEPSCQGKGAGRMLLEALEAWAKQRGCAGVRLVSGIDRTGAHRFYERCGYCLRKEQKNYVKYF